MVTKYKDKYGKNISVGDTIKFKSYNNWFTEVVWESKSGIHPFVWIDERCGFGSIDSEKCEIIGTK